MKDVLSRFTHHVWLSYDANEPRGTLSAYVVSAISALCYLGILAAALISLWRYEHNLHGRFWLGDLPVVALLLLLTTLLVVFGVTVSLVVVRRQRGEPRRARGAFVVRCLIVALMVCALVTALLGHFTVRVGGDMAASLLERCGESGTSSALERAYQRLAELHAGCRGGEEGRGGTVDQCQGFADAFPPPAPYARYLKVVESESRCAGFCHHAARQLFVAPNGRSGERRQGCAAYLGGHIQSTAHGIGAPCMALGLMYAILGALLLAFARPEQVRPTLASLNARGLPE